MASPAPSKFNLRNPAVKRIMQEIKEMKAEQCADFIADALEDDIFEWHFVVRGPPDTEFEGGIYHGRILLPAEYPFKPPSFMMLTPNGRFQTGVKVCLSISSHHPEHWQPSWSVRTALTALIAFMPTPGQGALGSLDFTKDERQQLAEKSRTEVPKFGSPARQKVINEMHQRMLQLQKQAAASSSSTQDDAAAGSPMRDAASAAAGAGSDQDSSKQQANSQQQQKQQETTKRSDSPPMQDTIRSSARDTAAKPPAAAAGSPAAAPAPVHAAAAAVAARQLQMAHGRPAVAAAVGSRPGELPSDRGLTFLAVVLTVAIAAVLLKKVMTAMGTYRLMV